MDAVKPTIGALFTYARDGAVRAARDQDITRAAILHDNATAGLLSILVFFLMSLVLSRGIVAPPSA